jgi:hypothetical protein
VGTEAEINHHTHHQQTFNQCQAHSTRKEESASSKWPEDKGKATNKRMNSDPHLTPYTKTTPNQIKISI